MAQQLTIALDAMGGDLGPDMVVPGAALSAVRHPDLNFLLFGDRAKIAAILDAHPKLASRAGIRHCDVFVPMDAKPSQALRQGRGKSSMWQAIEAVRKGEAQMAVSAGNTGALMAMARFILKTLPGIQRPAIAAIWPTLRSESIVLDVGATIGADAAQLVEFAVMGEAMARCLFGVDRPTVGLLNIGVEEIKGVEQVKEAARLLRQLHLPLEYVGFVEGDDIGRGTVDVVVTEGFTGNIALKAAEGTANQLASYLKLVLARTLVSRIGAVLASGAFAALKERMDPRKHNGGVFLGLNGVVVKSHGGTDPLGFATAVDVAVEMVRNDLVTKIKTDMVEMDRLGIGRHGPIAAVASAHAG
jgi:glycerol-3-phosphate acyltransferase PlsX